ncbi:phage tail protein [Serratia rubidaea]|uniref:phage tail protein n=1 Tax=Serratia rubidaea TaxID=61652 RepID=UPI001F384460|nr:phage tail protein [Serratia rubidaea]UJD81947.1 phage tail protein [Serratia rubidaea]UJD86510.1 phage tail protein [Serratia rubidaea]
MMLTLGLFVFMLQTLPYQTMTRQVEYRWPSNARIGLRPAMQFIGVDNETVTLSGVLMPEITGGRWSLMSLQLLADQGRAWPLVGGDGTIYGMFVIESLSEDSAEFFADGSARRTEFTLTLKRVDESLSAMFGDLRQQASVIYGSASQRVGGLFS